MTDPPPPLPVEQWRRLHPLSPLVRLGAVFGIVIVLLVSRSGMPPGGRAGRGQFSATVITYLVLGGLAFAGGIISWAVTRWRIHDDDLQIEMGLLRRQSFRIPLARIQAVDVVAPLVARILGLAEVRVVSAGRGLERGRLAYLSAREAPVIRAQLLALAHGLAAETPAPPARHLMRVDNIRLVVALFLRGPIVLIFLVTVVIPVSAVAIAPRQGVLLPGVLTSTLFVFALGTLRLVNEDWGFTISDSPDGFRLDRGLFQTRHETIPYGRVQGVRWVQPLLWRPLRWSRLEVDVARQTVSHRSDPSGTRAARVLMPVANRDQVVWLLLHVMPGVNLVPPPESVPPRRAAVKAPLSYHFLRAWSDDRYMIARTGRLRAATVVVPLWKVQSIRFNQGPVQRLLELASVHVDTAGHRWTAAARCRDAAEARQRLDTLAALARNARSRETATRGAAAAPVRPPPPAIP